jgi:hypothetical protein
VRDEHKLYRENVGREPETRFPDDPDWLYRGTKDEREDLASRVLADDDLNADQEPLFKEDP